MTYLGPHIIGNFKPENHRHTAKERAYYAYLHRDPLCCLTGQTHGVQVAHTGPKAMALKAPLSSCLPILHSLHDFEERHRAEFWVNAGFPDHLAWAERLFDLFETSQPKEPLIYDMIARANRAYLMEVLNK